jgi:hypothetical protein
MSVRMQTRNKRALDGIDCLSHSNARRKYDLVSSASGDSSSTINEIEDSTWEGRCKADPTPILREGPQN